MTSRGANSTERGEAFRAYRRWGFLFGLLSGVFLCGGIVAATHGAIASAIAFALFATAFSSKGLL